eukprot:gene3621-4059_t
MFWEMARLQLASLRTFCAISPFAPAPYPVLVPAGPIQWAVALPNSALPAPATPDGTKALLPSLPTAAAAAATVPPLPEQDPSAIRFASHAPGTFLAAKNAPGNSSGTGTSVIPSTINVSSNGLHASSTDTNGGKLSYSAFSALTPYRTMAPTSQATPTPHPGYPPITSGASLSTVPAGPGLRGPAPEVRVHGEEYSTVLSLRQNLETAGSEKKVGSSKVLFEQWSLRGAHRLREHVELLKGPSPWEPQKPQAKIDPDKAKGKDKVKGKGEGEGSAKEPDAKKGNATVGNVDVPYTTCVDLASTSINHLVHLLQLQSISLGPGSPPSTPRPSPRLGPAVLPPLTVKAEKERPSERLAKQKVFSAVVAVLQECLILLALHAKVWLAQLGRGQKPPAELDRLLDDLGGQKGKLRQSWIKDLKLISDEWTRLTELGAQGPLL